jgi:hypothetical protein
MNITGIARDYRVASISCAQRDRDVDNIRYSGNRAPRAYSQGQPPIERDH